MTIEELGSFKNIEHALSSVGIELFLVDLEDATIEADKDEHVQAALERGLRVTAIEKHTGRELEVTK